MSFEQIKKYKIIFKDTGNRKWETNDFYEINSFKTLTQKDHIYTGKLEFIKVIVTNDIERDMIVFKSPEEIKIPINRQNTNSFLDPLGLRIKQNNFWFFEDKNLKIYFTHNKKFTDFYCVISNQKFNNLNLDFHFEKAIEFLLSHPLNWIISSIIKNGKETIIIKSKPLNSLIPRKYPPLEIGSNHANDDLIDLFLKYFYYISNQNSEKTITSLVSQVIRSRFADIYTESLIHSVTIETLITNYFKRGKEKDSSLETDLKTIENNIDSLGVSSKLKNRVKGMISVIKSQKNTPKDILRVLLNEKVFDKIHFNSWNRLRNKSAHGNLDQIDLEKIINHNYNVIQLFHLLIFSLIEYEGSYKNYSKE